MVKRILIIYRGHCDRVAADPIYRNFLVKIKGPLERAGVEIDSLMMYHEGQRTAEAWKALWNPKEAHSIPLEHCKKQANTLHWCLNYLQGWSEVGAYDWILFLRFDVLYRVSILNWNLLNQSAGVVVPFREATDEPWAQKRYVSDVVIAISPSYLKKYLTAYEKALARFDHYFFHGTLHEQVKILEGTDIPLGFMFEGLYQSNTAKRPEGPLTSADDPRLSPFHILHSKPNYAGRDYRECFIGS